MKNCFFWHPKSGVVFERINTDAAMTSAVATHVLYGQEHSNICAFYLQVCRPDPWTRSKDGSGTYGRTSSATSMLKRPDTVSCHAKRRQKTKGLLLYCICDVETVTHIAHQLYGPPDLNAPVHILHTLRSEFFKCTLRSELF